MKKPRINQSSIRWLLEIDRSIRKSDIRGSVDRFHGMAAETLDGRALRSELDDLIRRRLLTVVRRTGQNAAGQDPRMCGTIWSVQLTERAIRVFWGDRIAAAQVVAQAA